MISKKINEKEPAPIKNKFPAVWDLVYADIIERDNKGKEKYGTRLQPFNGRNVLIDAYQEALDLVVYLRQAIFEKDYKETIEEQQVSHFDNLLCDCPVCQVIAKGNKSLKEVVLDGFYLALAEEDHTGSVLVSIDNGEMTVIDEYCTCNSKGAYFDEDGKVICAECNKLVKEAQEIVAKEHDEHPGVAELLVANEDVKKERALAFINKPCSCPQAKGIHLDMEGKVWCNDCEREDTNCCTCPGAVKIYLAADDIFRCRKCEKKFDRQYRP